MKTLGFILTVVALGFVALAMHGGGSNETIRQWAERTCAQEATALGMRDCVDRKIIAAAVFRYSQK